MRNQKQMISFEYTIDPFLKQEFGEEAYNAYKKLYLQYKLKQISSSEFKQKCENDESTKFMYHVCKGGSPDKNLDEFKIRNKQKSILTKDDYEKMNRSSSYMNGKLDTIDTQKINRLYAIMASTDNYNEYKQAHRELCKKLGRPSSSVIFGKIKDMNGTRDLDTHIYKSNYEKVTLKPGEVLVHVSHIPNITRLEGVFRSRDSRFYPQKRVYFRIGDMYEWSEFGRKKYVYVYDGKAPEIWKDGENSGGNDVYINTDTSVPVRQLTEEEIEKIKNKDQTKPKSNDEPTNKESESKSKTIRKDHSKSNPVNSGKTYNKLLKKFDKKKVKAGLTLQKIDKIIAKKGETQELLDAKKKIVDSLRKTKTEKDKYDKNHN